MREILLSMKPDWYNLCVSGIKIYEYRKNFPDDEVFAYIYVSSPEKAIKGIMRFGRRIPLDIWKEKYKDNFEIQERIENYKKRNKYVAPILSVKTIEPISLKELKENVSGFIAPQMYYYLKDDTELKKYITNKRQNAKNILLNDFSEEQPNEICKDYSAWRK